MGRSISGQILRVRWVMLSGWPWRYRGPVPLLHLISRCLLLITWPFRPCPHLSPSCWQAGCIGFFSPGGGPNTLLWVPHCALWVLGCHESGKTWRYEWLTWRNNQCLTSIMGWPRHGQINWMNHRLKNIFLISRRLSLRELLLQIYVSLKCQCL